MQALKLKTRVNYQYGEKLVFACYTVNVVKMCVKCSRVISWLLGSLSTCAV